MIKNKIPQKLSLFLLTFVFSCFLFGQTFAEEPPAKPKKEEQKQEEEVVVKKKKKGADVHKNARRNDIASHYILKKNGTLYRFVNGKRFFISYNASDLKISQHPQDIGVAYFIYKNDLYMIGNHFPKQTKRLERSIKKVRGKYQYHLVSSTHTNLVMTVLQNNGLFKGWDNRGVVYTQRNVKEYSMNPNFGPEKPFGRYVAFTLNYHGFITKINGRNPKGSKTDFSRRYNTSKEFIRENIFSR